MRFRPATLDSSRAPTDEKGKPISHESLKIRWPFSSVGGKADFTRSRGMGFIAPKPSSPSYGLGPASGVKNLRDPPRAPYLRVRFSRPATAWLRLRDLAFRLFPLWHPGNPWLAAGQVTVDPAALRPTAAQTTTREWRVPPVRRDTWLRSAWHRVGATRFRGGGRRLGNAGVRPSENVSDKPAGKNGSDPGPAPGRPIPARQSTGRRTLGSSPARPPVHESNAE